LHPSSRSLDCLGRATSAPRLSGSHLVRLLSRSDEDSRHVTLISLDHLTDLESLLSFEHDLVNEYYPPRPSKVLVNIGMQFRMFTTNYSVGFSHSLLRPGDIVFAVDYIQTPLILRECAPGCHQIIGECYLSSALELEYWDPGCGKGRWSSRPYDHGSDRASTIIIE
jgi:hypothetical protein